MAGTKSGLGKGFDALLPQDFDESLLLDKSERIQKVSLSKLKPQHNQPRKGFDEELIEELADSIKVHGILQPLVVSPSGTDSYIIIAGERRFRAAKLAGLDTLPVIVRTTKDIERLEIALVENSQRVDLSPIELAISIEGLHQQFNLSYQHIAKQIGKNFTTIHNLVRLLQLPKEAREALNKGEISEGHARAILAVRATPRQQVILLDSIKRFGWSVRRAEQFAVGIKSGLDKPEAIKRHMKTETKETKALGSKLSAPVNIRRLAQGGKLEIRFMTDDELKRIINSLLS